MKSPGRTKRLAAGAALVLAGFGVGAAVAVTGSASAATDAVSTGVGQAAQKLDPTKSIRPDEHLLTGTTAAKVKAAAVAKYPNATIQRVETDSDGVYEAHIVTSAGAQLIVQVGKDFTVTGTDSHGWSRWPGWPGRRPRRTAGLDERQRRLTAPGVRRPPPGRGAAAVPAGRSTTRRRPRATGAASAPAARPARPPGRSPARGPRASRAAVRR